MSSPRPVEAGASAKVRALETLASATRRARPLETLVELVIDQVAEVMTVDGAAVWLYRREDDVWYIGGSRGLTWRASQVSFPGHDSLLSRVEEEGEIVDDLAKAGFRRLYPEHERVQAALYAPMTIAGRRVGLIALYRELEDPFTEADLRFTRTVGAHIGVAISFAALEARSERLAVAEERARLGADLHDGVMQIFSALRVYADELAEVLVADSGALGEGRALQLASELRSCVERGSEEVQSMIAVLRDPEIRPELSRGLELARERLQAAGVSTELVYELEDVPDEVADALVWITREAASNIIRHSGAANAMIELRATGPVVELAVRDDGAGVDLLATAGSGRTGDGAHLGIGLMRERAEQLGGELEVDAGRAGLAVRVRVPTSAPPVRGEAAG